MAVRMGVVVCLVVALAVVVGSRANEVGHGNASGAVGIFDGNGDVGNVEAGLKGGVVYDAAKGTYTVSGSGENMWFGADAFQFVWKQASGDVEISADISFLGEGKNPHRKGVVMVRQSLDADSAYADVALHGVGLTSLQFREEKGATTHEVQANVNAPKRIRLVKHGGYYTMWVAGGDGKFVLAGATPLLAIREPFYVGIGLCSHDKDVMEKAVFSRVSVKERPSQGPGPAVKLYSFLEVIGGESGDRRAIYVAEGRFEAPNWMKDGKRLLFNRGGRIETIDVNGGTPEKLDTGFAAGCNNDHGISPDGRELVVSDGSQGDHESRVYTLLIGGGTPRLVTRNAPSYWHGWSPDGKTLAFVGQREGEFDVYTISVSGGEEKRLTTAKGLDDGPEYTPDGKYIYFNSVRTGHMQIWRMKADGSEQEQVTNDSGNDWFPHFSPDGKWMVFLTYDASVEGHPENKDVTLRMMSMEDGKIRDVARLYGGQGTINVPSWSPDGKSFAFVSYAWVPQEGSNQ
jgi:TolB protein